MTWAVTAAGYARDTVIPLIQSISRLSDEDLLAHVKRAAERERRATAELIALLMELDARRLYRAEGCSSLFTYCTQVLHLSEHAAYGRIEAARAARRFPVILTRLAEGTITLTAIGLLAPHLTFVNHLEVLESARGKSKRDVEQIVARLHPRPDAPAAVRKLPEAKATVGIARPAVDQQARASATLPVPSAPTQRPPKIEPLAPERFKIQFTVSRETYEMLRRVQDLLRHSIPNGDVAAIFERALALLLAEASRTKLAAAGRPRPPRAVQPSSRRIPAAARRDVWQRDGGRCAFVGVLGRCTETGFLEFHHIVPFAEGGKATSANLELRCRAHNAYEAERWFGTGPRPPLLRERVGSAAALARREPRLEQRPRQIPAHLAEVLLSPRG